jgi:hypothetical protein
MTGIKADNCGNCVTAERSVTVRPYLTEPDGDHGIRAYYRCPECGHRWWTAWLVGTEGLAGRNETAA